MGDGCSVEWAPVGYVCALPALGPRSSASGSDEMQ